jgi:hypothetical protein
MVKVGFSFRQTSLFIAALCFVAGAAHAGDKIPVVEDGRVSYIDSDEYAKTLQTAFSFVYASTLPALQVTPQCASGSMCLRTVSVGLGVTASFSLGPIGSVAVTPRASLIFSDGPIGDDPNF